MTASPSAADAGTITLGDLTVNRLGFGAMRITGSGVWGPPPDHDTALAVLQSDAPTSQAELARMCGLLPAQLVAVIDELERDGLAERRRDDADRRRSVVRLTPKGRRLLARGDALAARIEDELLGHLDSAQRVRLHEVLRQALEPSWPLPAHDAE